MARYVVAVLFFPPVDSSTERSLVFHLCFVANGNTISRSLISGYSAKLQENFGLPWYLSW